MGDFRRLIVWRRAHALVLHTYRTAAGFPPYERYDLSAQVRRAVVSICANIAEGTGRESDRDQARFYQMALGSARELECLILLARDLGFIAAPAHAGLALKLDEIERMLVALIRRSRAARQVVLPPRH